MMPPDDLIRKLYRALVRADEDRDTFDDVFLWMHRHPCLADEYEHRFVTRFYFFRKDRWLEASRFVPLSSAVEPTTAPYDGGGGAGGTQKEQFINTLRDAIHKATRKKRQPKAKGKR